MSIKRTIITAIVGLTLVAVVAPAGAQALTVEDLLAQIAQLQSQLLALQGGSQTAGTGGTGACTGITFTRNLTVGSTGSDVKCLQQILNQSASTQVAASGAGSPGNETSYFGQLTLVAVKKYQVAHGWTPANQVGPMTRQSLNAYLASSGTPGTPGTPVPTGAGLTVQLASNNPASGTIVDGQALYPLTRLTFLNGDNAEVKVTGLKLKRIGVSADASVVNTYLFDGATRLTDGSAVSSTIINFNNSSGLFTVPAGSSKTISVLADINGSASETFGIQVVASTDVTTNASSVKGAFPVTSNLHTLSSGTLAGVEFGTATPSSIATIDPQNDYTMWQDSVVVTTRAVDLTRISFRKTGSVKDADLQNFRLYVDGVQVGSAIPNIVLNSNNESLVTFDLTSSPKRLEAGTRVIKLLGDIIGGSSLNFTWNLWNSADVTFVDSQYMANVLPDLTADASFTKRSTEAQTIGSGTITITKTTDSPTGNIVNGASNALLAKFQLKAAGEKVKIETLYVSANVNTAAVSGLRNGALYANGVQIGSTTTLYDPADTSYDYTTFNLGSSLIVDPASPVTLEVKADVYDTGTGDTTNSITTTGTASTIQVVIEGSTGWNNGTGMSSASTIDVPASDVTGNSLTVAAGGLTLSIDTSYANHSVVAPLYAYKLGDFNLAANTTEAVNITAINVTLGDISGYISNLYVKYGEKVTSTKTSITTNANTWSINEVLAAGATIPLEVYADVSSGMSSNTSQMTVDVDGTTVSSAVTADSSGTTGGQTLTYTSGAFATAFASTPQNQTVGGGQTVEVGRWRFTSSYDAYTIEEIKIDPDVAATSSAAAENGVAQAVLKDGTTVLQTQSFNAVNTDGSTGGFLFTGLNVLVPASTSKTLTVDFVMATPSATDSTDGLRIQPALTWTKYRNSQGSVSTSTTERDGNSTYLFKTVPTITKEALTSTTLINNSAVDLFKFRVAAPTQGDISIKQFKLDVAWSDGGGNNDALELETFKLYKDGNDISTLVTLQNEDGYTISTATDGLSEEDSKIIVTWLTDTEDTIQAGTSTVYTLRATPQGFNQTATTATYAASDSVAISFNTDTADASFGSTTIPFVGYLNLGTSVTSVLKIYNDTTAALGYTANASADDANLIWSDRSAVAHSAAIDQSSTQTGDWANSYLLKSSLSPQAWTD